MIEVVRKLTKHLDMLVGKVKIDSNVSVLHYRITTILLLVFCALVSSQQYFGDPIQCIQDASGDDAAIPSHVLNTFCFITSTYTHINEKGSSWKGSYEKMSIRRHSYYQWVPLVLFLQALVFSLPHALWSYMENGFLEGCLKSLYQGVDKHREDNIKSLASYLSQRFNSLQIWAYGYLGTEILNAANVICNFIFIDYFLGGHFLEYGLKVHKGYQEKQEREVAEHFFPKLTKCDFYKYGASGTIQKIDALCLMALNVINDKIFTFLWFWFLLLAVLSILSVMVNTIIYFMIWGRLRGHFLKNWVTGWKGIANKYSFFNRLTLGDLIFLKQLKENVDSISYGLILKTISNSMANFVNDTNENNLV